MIETIDLLALQTAPIPLEDLWGTTIGFTTIFVTCMGILGLFSGRMTIAAFSAYISFVYIATTAQGMPLLTNVVYVSLVVVCIGLGFKLVRLEAFGNPGGS